MYYYFNIDYTFVKNSDVGRGDIMKYIKNYYDLNEYTNILNHFFKIFINDNFINISEYEYKSIFNDIITNISFDILNNNIKSDKKLFNVVRENILFLIDNKIIIIDEIYKKSFKSNEYIRNNLINYDYFHLDIKDKYKF